VVQGGEGSSSELGSGGSNRRPVERIVLRHATLAFEPNVWAILIYAQLCSLYYFVNMTFLGHLIQLFRLAFGFRALEVTAWLPAGVTNYQAAVAASIFSAVSPRLEIGSILFWVVIPTFTLRESIRAGKGQNAVRMLYGKVGSFSRVDLRAIFRAARRFALLSLLLYIGLFSAFSAYQDFQTSSLTGSPNGLVAEEIVDRDCVQWVVTRANGTIEQSKSCDQVISGGATLIPAQTASTSSDIHTISHSIRTAMQSS